MLGNPLNENELLKLANEMEGHPDNVAPALLGGLVVSIITEEEIITRRYEVPEITIVIVKPSMEWLTKTARSVLPKSVSRADSIYNIGRTALVVDAFRNGDLDLLQKVMDDRIHQPYRLKHISGGMSAYKTAKQFGAAALSGSGPSIIAFVPPKNAERAKAKIQSVFEERGIETRGIITKPGSMGVHCI
jgi:homoserine kinase